MLLANHPRTFFGLHTVDQLHRISVHLFEDSFEGVLFFVDIKGVFLFILYIGRQMRNGVQICRPVFLVITIKIGDGLGDSGESDCSIGFVD